MALIELEMSLASMIAALLTGTATVRCGRAAAAMSRAMAIAKTSIGACRRQRGRRGVTESVMSGAANAAAALAAPALLADVPDRENGDRDEPDEDKGRGEAHGYGVGGAASVATRVRMAPPLLISSVTLSPECRPLIASEMLPVDPTGWLLTSRIVSAGSRPAASPLL